MSLPWCLQPHKAPSIWGDGSFDCRLKFGKVLFNYWKKEEVVIKSRFEDICNFYFLENVAKNGLLETGSQVFVFAKCSGLTRSGLAGAAQTASWWPRTRVPPWCETCGPGSCRAPHSAPRKPYWGTIITLKEVVLYLVARNTLYKKKNYNTQWYRTCSQAIAEFHTLCSKETLLRYS
jgi:hypothetical protein